MTGERNGDRDDRLNEVILAYMDALQAGQRPDRLQLLAAHPDLHADLEAFFAGHDDMERLAAPVRKAWTDGFVADAVRGYHTTPNTFQGEPSGMAIACTETLGQLGEYRLLREVGRGGMGVVYEAEQVTLRRRVALKVLPFAAAIDPRHLQRFKNEALAAANLRHPNIVPVYAVGAELGVHYYAMQFIEGQSLAALIVDLRRSAGKSDPGAAAPSSQLRAIHDDIRPHISTASVETKDEPAASVAATLVDANRSVTGRKHFDWLAGVGRQAALALEHAHQFGIVHRDIKPANLLLDPHGQLWVTDFGLAQVTGDAGLTVTGELLGTLRYASPEQARARRGLVDHRTDIYSLGATLYELLTLCPIFQGQSRHELLQQIADEEPRPPRSIDPSVPPELETIVLKALSKDPADRYSSAQDLADDLGRFIEDRPILARRPSISERLRKWARRHPSAVASGIIVLFLITAGSLLSAALIHNEQHNTRVEQMKAEKRAEEAEARFRLAKESVDELIRASEEELMEVPGMEGLRKRFLTTALASYMKFVEQRRDDPMAQADLLDTKKKVEKILGDLALLRAAGQLRLLSQPAVLDDLHLDARQRAKVKMLSARVAKQWTEAFHDLGRLSPSDRKRRSLEQARANEETVKQVLTEKQRDRLRQIGLQSDMTATLSEPDVAAALRLTNDQREQIRRIVEEALASMLKQMVPRLALELAVTDPITQTTAAERILALLTEEQVKRWQEITGERFNGPVTLFPFPFGPQETPRGDSEEERAEESANESR
jgi:eukaryotic-like serine/threonine-protein kinase